MNYLRRNSRQLDEEPIIRDHPHYSINQDEVPGGGIRDVAEYEDRQDVPLIEGTYYND